MRMNRRNVLVGLGTIVAGGGAALGTGAFSSVEAERTVAVSTAGDASALFQLKIMSGELHDNSDGSSGAIEFNQDSLNESALTRFDPGLQVGNDGSNPIEVSVDAEGGQASFAQSVDDTAQAGMYFVDSDAIEDVDGADTLTLNASEVGVNLEVVFNVDDGSSIPSSITFTATDSS